MVKPLVLGVLVLLLFLMVNTAEAATPVINNADILDSILLRFQNTASFWNEQLKAYANFLFWGLALISMVWTFGFMALKKVDLGAIVGEMILFFVTTGFFYWLLLNGPAIAGSIMDSCRQMAARASGLNQTVSPSSIIDIGFDIAARVVDQSSVLSPASSIVGLLVATIILIVLTLVSVNLLIVLISGWILAYGGVFLLGFGGGRWTQDIAINYYRTVLAIGIEMSAMVFIVGIGRSFVDQFYATIGNGMTFKELLVMLVVSFVLLLLVDKIPPRLAAIPGGSGGGGSSSFGFGVGGALGMAAGAATMAAGAAGAVAVSGAGGLSALKAAFQAAQSSMNGSSSTGGASGSSGSLASAMGSAGRLVSEMGSQLTSAAAQTAKEGFNAMKEGAQSRVSETFGGRMAETIKANNQPESASGNNNFSSSGTTPQFDENSLSQGQPTICSSSNDEVANFVNKSAPFGKGVE